MATMEDRKLHFLRTIYRKYCASDENVIEAVITELERRDHPLMHDLMLTYQQMCSALSQPSSPDWFDKAYDQAAKAFHSAEKQPLQRVWAMKIIITTMVIRCSMGYITEKEAMEEVKGWLGKINTTEMREVMQCIQKTKPTATTNMRRLIRQHTSLIIGKPTRCSKELVYLEFMKLAVASIKFFSRFDSIKKMVIHVPNRADGDLPHGMPVGALFMNLASYILEKQLTIDGDRLYFIKELTMMKGTLEFIAYELPFSDIVGWRSRTYSNAGILKEVGRKIFRRCIVLSDYKDGNGTEIRRGENLEVIESNVDECHHAYYLVRRKGDRTMGFRVPRSCFDVTGSRATSFEQVLKEIRVGFRFFKS